LEGKEKLFSIGLVQGDHFK